MSSKRTTRTNKRPPLTRERVLHAAIAIADETGLESLTMRRLGSRLNVEAMSLYKHVAGKDDVLDGIVDLVISEIELPTTATDWKSAMRQRAMSARQVLASHPWAIGMMESRNAMGPAALHYVDAVIGSLRNGGFSVPMAAHAFLLLDSYIYGFVVQEASFHTSDKTAAPTETALSAGEQFPHLREMATAFAGGYDYTDEFEFGLDLILDGLDRIQPTR